MSGQVQNAKFVSAHARALIAVALLLACALLDLAGLVLHLLRLFEAGPFSQTANDIASLEAEASAGDLLVGFTTLAQISVYVATVVAFLVWEHRAYKNLRAFATKTEFSPGWVVGNWFIPFLNLVLPYQAVKELWIKSDPAVDFSGGFARAAESARPTVLVGVWWFFWIVANVAGRVYARLSSGDDAGISVAASRAGFASNALSLVAALLAGAVVWTIARMQAEKSARVGFGLWSSPPPPPASFIEASGSAQTPSV